MIHCTNYYYSTLLVYWLLASKASLVQERTHRDRMIFMVNGDGVSQQLGKEGDERREAATVPGSIQYAAPKGSSHSSHFAASANLIYSISARV